MALADATVEFAVDSCCSCSFKNSFFCDRSIEIQKAGRMFWPARIWLRAFLLIVLDDGRLRMRGSETFFDVSATDCAASFWRRAGLARCHHVPFRYNYTRGIDSTADAREAVDVPVSDALDFFCRHHHDAAVPEG
jgi:hypothetical protein